MIKRTICIENACFLHYGNQQLIISYRHVSGMQQLLNKTNTYGVIEMMQSCIKVFTDKLGRKVVPHWEFLNGCWDKETAKRLKLIQ